MHETFKMYGLSGKGKSFRNSLLSRIIIFHLCKLTKTKWETPDDVLMVRKFRFLRCSSLFAATTSKNASINVYVLSSEHASWPSPRSEMPTQKIRICPHPLPPAQKANCVVLRNACSAPLETSHVTVFLLLQRFGCLNYVCLTRLFFPSCAKFPDIHFVCIMSIFYD